MHLWEVHVLQPVPRGDFQSIPAGDDCGRLPSVFPGLVLAIRGGHLCSNVCALSSGLGGRECGAERAMRSVQPRAEYSTARRHRLRRLRARHLQHWGVALLPLRCGKIHSARGRQQLCPMPALRRSAGRGVRARVGVACGGAVPCGLLLPGRRRARAALPRGELGGRRHHRPRQRRGLLAVRRGHRQCRQRRQQQRHLQNLCRGRLCAGGRRHLHQLLPRHVQRRAGRHLLCGLHGLPRGDVFPHQWRCNPAFLPAVRRGLLFRRPRRNVCSRVP